MLLYLALFYGIAHGYCQQHSIDSLKSVIVTDKDDRAKANQLEALCILYEKSGNGDSAILVGKEAEVIREKLKDFKGQASALITLGTIYFDKHDLQTSLNFFLKSLKITENDATLKAQTALAFDNIGLVYESEGNFTNARNYYLSAMKIVKGISNLHIQAYIFNSIADFYSSRGNELKALEYYLDAVKLNEKFGNKDEMAKGYNNIGVLYKSEEDYSKAMLYFAQALNSAKDGGNIKIQANIESNIASCYYEKGDYSNALNYDIQTLMLAQTIKSCGTEEVASSNIGLLYWKKSDYSKALQYYEKALECACSSGDKSGQGIIYYNMSMVCSSQGDIPKAFEYGFNALNVSTALKDKEATAVDKNLIGEIYTKQKNYKEAENFILQALYLADTIQLLQTIENSSLDLSNLFGQTGEEQKACATYLQYLNAKEKLATKTVSNETGQLQFKAKNKTRILIQRIENSKEAMLEDLAVQRRTLSITLIIVLLLISGAIAILRIRMHNVSIDKQENIKQDDYLIFYMPHASGSGLFCRRESSENLTLIAFGASDDVDKLSELNLLKKCTSLVKSREPSVIIVKVRELLELNRQDSGKVLDPAGISLAVLNHSEFKLGMENIELFVWVKGKKSLIELPPNHHHSSISDRSIIHTCQFAKGDLLYIFSSSWFKLLGEDGITIFKRKLNIFLTISMEEQRRTLKELFEKSVKNIALSEDLLIFAERI